MATPKRVLVEWEDQEQGRNAFYLRTVRLVRDMISCWWVAFSLSSVCVVGGHLMIKRGLNSILVSQSHGGTVARLLQILAQPAVDLGLLVYLFGSACWIIAVSQKEISFLYPLSSVNYVLVALASTLLLSEPLHARRVEGVLLIAFGMVLLYCRGAEEPQ